MSPRAQEIARLQAEASRLRAESAAALQRGDGRAAGIALNQALLREEMIALLDSRPKTAHDGTMEQAVSRELKISRSKSRTRPPEVEALAKAGLTPRQAADLCGTTRDVLKQAWAKGPQFRPIRPEWKKRLAAAGVPAKAWRSK